MFAFVIRLFVDSVSFFNISNVLVYTMKSSKAAAKNDISRIVSPKVRFVCFKLIDYVDNTNFAVTLRIVAEVG